MCEEAGGAKKCEAGTGLGCEREAWEGLAEKEV
jgi:hypothetical protein